MNLYSILRPLLFSLPAEAAHDLSLQSLKLAMHLPGIKGALGAKHANLPKTVAGITFRNPVGLAAGLDKNARFYHELFALGFGFIEIGTVTPRPQAGNAKPRLFRLPRQKAVINRMGFNNDGVAAVAKRLENRTDDMVIGGNIGKNKDTPNEQAEKDYVACFSALNGLVDYFVINLSSPNTPGLRELQNKEGLQRILGAVQDENHRQPGQRPVFLKIAPDLTNEQLDEIVEIALKNKLDGLVATNTTIERDGLEPDRVAAIGEGGMSGAPLTNKSTAVLNKLRERSQGKLALIGSGGVMTAQDAMNKFSSGADLVQLYTGFVFSGPGLIGEILDRIR
ncbi:MAG: quinone-dependent dihydroorotate dehydrogenase [Bacteroidia bacterium]